MKFTPAAARKLADAGRFFEQQRRSQAPDLAGPVQFGGLTMLVLTVACNPMSTATPGINGRGKIQQLTGSTPAYSDLASTVYPVANDTSNTIAIGSYVGCLPGPGGLFHVVIVDQCSNLS